jgi:hypothetical protein
MDLTNEQEIWKPVLGGWYAVSSIGRVRRIRGTRRRPVTGRVLKPFCGGVGYPVVSPVVGDLKPKPITVHSLVAEAFVGPRPKGHWVNHIDGNKQNNHYCNLEYVTPRQNTEHAVRLGLHPCGSRHGHAKLNEDQVRTIKGELAAGAVQLHLAKRYGVEPQIICRISKGKIWRSVK